MAPHLTCSTLSTQDHERVLHLSLHGTGSHVHAMRHDFTLCEAPDVCGIMRPGTPTVGSQEGSWRLRLCGKQESAQHRSHARVNHSHLDAGSESTFARIVVTTATFCNRLPLKLSRVYASQLRGSVRRLCHRGQQVRVPKSGWRPWFERSAAPTPFARQCGKLIRHVSMQCVVTMLRTDQSNFHFALTKALGLRSFSKTNLNKSP